MIRPNDLSLQILKSVFTLTIYGMLKWDTSKDDLKLSATYVLVKDGGKDSKLFCGEGLLS